MNTVIKMISFFFTILLLNTSAMASVWQKPDDAALRKKLTSLQYYVTQQQGTEPAFKNLYWNNEQAGIYVDVVSGDPLFSSLDKYDSGTGWPSFTRPLDPKKILLRKDSLLSELRTEVVAKMSGSHLGHVFDDGPAPTHKRYCMNSAALEFIPVADLKKRGYEKYTALFASPSEGKKQ